MTIGNGYLIGCDNDDDSVYDAYSDFLDFAEPFKAASQYMKQHGCPGQLYREDDDGMVLVGEFDSFGRITYSRFVFFSEEDDVQKTREFPTIFDALEYAKRWTSEHQLDDEGKSKAKVIGGTPDPDGGFVWKTCWEFEKPDFICVWYTTGYGFWFLLDDVQNISSDIMECLINYDPDFGYDPSTEISRNNVTLYPPDTWERGDLVADARFRELEIVVEKTVPELMIKLGFNLNESIVYTLDNLSDMDAKDISEFMEKMLGKPFSEQAVWRFRDDTYLKLKIRDEKMPHLYNLERFKHIHKQIMNGHSW